MPLEDFIISVFCWVEVELAQILQGRKLRARGYAPRLSDSEVITMDIVGPFWATPAMRRSGNISAAMGWRGFQSWAAAPRSVGRRRIDGG